MKIKILQWNVWNNECLNNADGLIKFINDVDADVVCLQELCKEPGKTEGLQKIINNFKFGHFAVAHEWKDGKVQGNGIFSKYPQSSIKDLYIQDAIGSKNYDESDYSKEGRVYTEASISLPKNKSIVVGTTHSSYTHGFTETEAKDKEISRLISYLKQHPNKFIFCGDLNATENNKYINSISKVLKLCSNKNIKTWTTKPFSYNGFEVNSLDYRLDYFFATNDVVVLKEEVLKTELSDHLPILLTIDV